MVLRNNCVGEFKEQHAMFKGSEHSKSGTGTENDETIILFNK